MSEDTRHKLLEVAAAVVISLAFYLIAQTSPYARIELLSLDARFNLRPPIPVNPDIATIDIDGQTLTEEGRWQDWTRDRHARIIDVVRRGGGGLLGFDIYFSEESEQVLRPADVARARSIEEVHAAFRDYDAELAEAAKRAGNVFWSCTFVLDDEKDLEEPAEDDSYSGSAELAWKNYGYVVDKQNLSIRAEKKRVGGILQAMAWNNLDALIYPAVQEPPAKIGETQGGTVTAGLGARARFPSITVPAGFTNDGLPVGIEFLARAFEEPRLIELAYAFEQGTQFRRPPNLPT